MLTGYLGRLWILSKIWESIHQLLLRIPVVRKIYHSSYEVVSTLLREEKRGFSEVITFPFGDTNAYAIGLLPRRDISTEHHLPILFPGTPNPLQGFLLFVDEKEVHLSSVSVDKALKWTISIGTTPLG
jgi:uncharacterized membrane protein